MTMNCNNKTKNKCPNQEKKKSKADWIWEMYKLLFSTENREHVTIDSGLNPVPKKEGWISMTRDEWKKIARKVAEKAADIGIATAIGSGEPGAAAVGALFHSTLWGLMDIRKNHITTQDIEALAEPDDIFIEELRTELTTRLNIQEDAIDLLQEGTQEVFRRTASAIENHEFRIQEIERAMMEFQSLKMHNLSHNQLETLVSLSHHLNDDSKKSVFPETKGLEAFVDEVDVLDILNQATEIEIDTIAHRLKVPKQYMPGDSAPPGKKVLFLIDYSKGLKGSGLASLLWAYSKGRVSP